MKEVIVCAEASAVHLKNAIVDFLAKEGYEFVDATSRDDLTYIEAGSCAEPEWASTWWQTAIRASTADCASRCIQPGWRVRSQTATCWRWEAILWLTTLPAAW